MLKPVRLPWNQETLLGYFGLICTTCTGGAIYFIFDLAILLFFISICLHHHAFYKMFQHFLHKMELIENSNKKKLICDQYRFHIMVKELV